MDILEYAREAGRSARENNLTGETRADAWELLLESHDDPELLDQLETRAARNAFTQGWMED